MHQFGYEWHAAGRDSLWVRIREVVEDGADLKHIGDSVEREMTIPIILGLGFGEQSILPAVNIPNRGFIPNLLAEGIVEVPAIVDGAGIHGCVIGDLPEPIAGWCNLQISICNLVAEAGVTGSREKALQALLLDPIVNDVEQAEEILDAYLHLHAQYLPQFV